MWGENNLIYMEAPNTSGSVFDMLIELRIEKDLNLNEIRNDFFFDYYTRLMIMREKQFGKKMFELNRGLDEFIDF